MTSIYAQRRARLAAQLGEDAIALIPTAAPALRNRDSDYPYRHDSYFYYLTGFTEPDAWLLLDGKGHSSLFCQPKDVEREIWDGLRLGPQAAVQSLGVDEAFSSTELEQRIPALLENRRTVWWPFALHRGLAARLEAWLGQVRSRARTGVLCPAHQSDVCALLDEMRLIKDRGEQETIRRAAQISALGHVRAMRRSARMLRQGEDVREYHLEAELLHAFRECGSQAPAYNSIVAAGANACVLHYRAGDAPVRDGELVLIDAACELDGYASDITRTFPANGRFTGPQRALYDLVLASQQAAVAATRPGARFDEPHHAALAVLAQGMLDLRLLDADSVGNAQDVIASRAYFPFYMHRTSHWMGMDVHDCGSYSEPGEADQVHEETDALSGQTVLRRPSRILRPGMVLTIEPGIYVRPDSGAPAAFHGMGIRIEDDAIVTDEGCELVSRSVPVEPDAIEALMKD
ncbi:aminopeptidase P N-terminal domain-containing protein [Comamonas sp. NLF-1-9]|uniref:aminopeptidase P N-terminal domain-containing protein n=1 Tax=Comamonas sp. NLF-1-9 TaxID=2853163 RepID=UPI001C4952A2|nr:aminopeptidase P N-terminal domain-containing protein [Comamonas sp. NLF-1-9]QXL84293.1 aminopeptidase P N-terminal domain-containing protein [Comamonas sp. NLF-1-9]